MDRDEAARKEVDSSSIYIWQATYIAPHAPPFADPVCQCRG